MSQDSKVQVVADAMGNTIRQNQNKPDYGYIRLVQKRTTISPTGFISASNLSTLLTGTIEDLEASGLQHTKEIAGKLFLINYFYIQLSRLADQQINLLSLYCPYLLTHILLHLQDKYLT